MIKVIQHQNSFSELFICTKNEQNYFCISALMRGQYQVSSFFANVICLFLSCAQPSTANAPSLGKKPKNIFVCILVQVKTLLEFWILLTFGVCIIID